MKIYEKTQLYNRKTGKPDVNGYCHNALFVCDYCGRIFNSDEEMIYENIKVHESGDITQAFFYAHKDLNVNNVFLVNLYTNNAAFHFCPDQDDERCCELDMMTNFTLSNNKDKYKGISWMLYKSRNEVIKKLMKQGYTKQELCGAEYE